MEQTKAALMTWVREEAQTAMRMYDAEEMLDPRLLVRVGNEIHYYWIMLDGDRRQTKTLINTFVAHHDPEAALLLVEGWKSTIDRTDPRATLIEAGKMQVRDLPPEDRGDSLILFGENRAGDTVHAIFDIQIDASGERHFAEEDWSTDAAVSSVFLPLFTFRDLMRPPASLDEEKARKRTQQLARLILQQHGETGRRTRPAPQGTTGG